MKCLFLILILAAAHLPAYSSAPTVTTASVVLSSDATATASGTVTADGGSSVTDRGVAFGTSVNPTSPCTGGGAGTGDFSGTLTGLTANTLYHYRACATNSIGTGYGSDHTFTFTPNLSTVPATCTVHSTASCPNDPNQSPDLATWVSSISTVMNTVAAGVVSKRQNRPVLSGQVVIASSSWITSDASGCNTAGSGSSNICQFNKASVINSYIDGMVRRGIQSLDINLWMGPINASAECTAASCQVGTYSGYNSWYTYSLGVYDSVMAHAQSLGVPVRLAPIPSTDVFTKCNAAWTSPFIAGGGLTEANLESCLVPLERAMAARWGVTSGSTSQVVTDITTVHEPTGVLSLLTAKVFTTAEMSAFVHAASAAIRVGNSNVRVGVGYIRSEDTGTTNNYLAAYLANNISDLNFIGADIYGGVNAATYYSAILSQFETDAAAIIAAGLDAVVNETAPPRHVPSGASNGGEANSYEGCGWSFWDSSGYTEMWNDIIAHRWMGATGYKIVSIYPTGPHFLTVAGTTVGAAPGYLNGSNCNDNTLTTGYYAQVTSNLSVDTRSGTSYGAKPGISMQGHVTTTGHVLAGYSTGYPSFPTAVDCVDASPVTCVPIPSFAKADVTGIDPAATGGFRGHADASERTDPNFATNSTLWMSYSWPHTVNGGGQYWHVIDTHLAKSTDRGVTWSFIDTLFPSTQLCNLNSHPGGCSLVTDYDWWAHEVSNIYWVPCGNPGEYCWISVNTQYPVAASSSGAGGQSYGTRMALRMCKDTGTGPLCLKTASVYYIGTSVGNTDQTNFPTNMNTDQVAFPVSGTASCYPSGNTMNREPSLLSLDGGGHILIDFACGSINAVNQFTASIPTSAPYTSWGTWSVVGTPNTFATPTQAATMWHALTNTSPGTVSLTQMDIAKSKEYEVLGCANTIVPGCFVVPISVVYTVSGVKHSLGCVIALLDSPSPLTFSTDGSGNVLMIAAAKSSDSAAGDSTGMGSCTYEPKSVMGLLVAHKITQTNGSLFTYFMQLPEPWLFN